MTQSDLDRVRRPRRERWRRRWRDPPLLLAASSPDAFEILGHELVFPAVKSIVHLAELVLLDLVVLAPVARLELLGVLLDVRGDEGLHRPG